VVTGLITGIIISFLFRRKPFAKKVKE
jgi:hypothetical protein